MSTSQWQTSKINSQGTINVCSTCRGNAALFPAIRSIRFSLQQTGKSGTVTEAKSNMQVYSSWTWNSRKNIHPQYELYLVSAFPQFPKREDAVEEEFSPTEDCGKTPAQSAHPLLKTSSRPLLSNSRRSSLPVSPPSAACPSQPVSRDPSY